MSPRIETAWPPLPWMTATVSSALTELLAKFTTTAKRAAARRMATTCPMPRDAPVTIATLRLAVINSALFHREDTGARGQCSHTACVRNESKAEFFKTRPDGDAA